MAFYGTVSDGDQVSAAWMQEVEDRLGGGNPGASGSYVFYRQDSVYYARNGMTGEIDYSGSVAKTVFDNATAALYNGVANLEGGTIVLAVDPSDTAVFSFTAGVTIPEKVSVIGQCRGRVPRLSFEQIDSSDCMTVVGASGSSAPAYSILKNFRITGTAGTTGNGIVIPKNVNDVTISNIVSDGHGGSGFHFDGCYHVGIDNCTGASNGDDGFEITDDSGITWGELTFLQCKSLLNTGCGLQMVTGGGGGGSNVAILGGTYEQNTSYGIATVQGPISMVGVKCEANTEHQLYWSSTGCILGNYFQSAPTNKYGIYTAAGTYTEIRGNRFASNWRDIFIDSTSHHINIPPQSGITTLATDIQVDVASYDHDIFGRHQWAGGTTDANGRVALTFQFAFTVKPEVMVTLESNDIWYILSWSTDGSARYDGCTIQVTTHAGVAVGAAVAVNAQVRRAQE
jgi:hypothetical protein